MFDALGYPPDHPHLVAARGVDREAARRQARTRPIASPACRRSGTRRSPPMRCWKPATRRARAAARAAARLARAAPGARRQGRLGRPAPGRPPRRLGVPVRQPALSRSRRHRRRGDGDGPRRSRRRHRSPGRASPSDRARARMDRGPAKPRRRLGRLRRRQHLLTISTTSPSPITARCSIRRPPTSPRAASRCWRSSARRARRARRWRADSTR